MFSKYEYVRCPVCDKILFEVADRNGSVLRVKCRGCGRYVYLSV